MFLRRISSLHTWQGPSHTLVRSKGLDQLDSRLPAAFPAPLALLEKQTLPPHVATPVHDVHASPTERGDIFRMWLTVDNEWRWPFSKPGHVFGGRAQNPRALLAYPVKHGEMSHLLGQHLHCPIHFPISTSRSAGLWRRLSCHSGPTSKCWI